MDEQLHVSILGSDTGPLSAGTAREQAAEALVRGEIPTIWAQGWPEWRPATEVWPDLSGWAPLPEPVRPSLGEELRHLRATPASEWVAREWRTVGVLAAAVLLGLVIWFGILGTLLGGMAAFFLIVVGIGGAGWVHHQGGIRAVSGGFLGAAGAFRSAAGGFLDAAGGLLGPAGGLSGSAGRIAGVVAYTFIGLVIGTAMGVFFPIFHEIASYGEIGSPIRNSVIPKYIIAGGVLGFIGGTIGAFVVAKGPAAGGGAYHLSIAGRTYAGLPTSKVRELLIAAPVAAQTATVWQEGWSEWRPVRDFFPVPPVV